MNIHQTLAKYSVADKEYGSLNEIGYVVGYVNFICGYFPVLCDCWPTRTQFLFCVDLENYKRFYLF